MTPILSRRDWLKLTTAGARLLARSHTLRVTLTATLENSTPSVSRRLILRSAKAKKRR